MSKQSMSLDNSFAIVGVNCRLPGIDENIDNIDALAQLLFDNKSIIKKVPKNRFSDKFSSQKGGFLHNIKAFDAGFFNLSGSAVKQMDPQQRLFLEVSMQALRHANVLMSEVKGSPSGVYCGVSTHEYNLLNQKDDIKTNVHTVAGASNSSIPGRLSHFLDLKGPSLSIDTACTSSLSALNIALNDLSQGITKLAIVGGVHLSLCEESFSSAGKALLLSESGQCQSFQNTADGYVRSEGCVVIVLKRLVDALDAKDKILAVVKSVAINQNGKDACFSAPSQQAQIDVQKKALLEANISAADVSYIETHGNGIKKGDTTELAAIKAIHKDKHSKDTPLLLGALKTNLGLLLSACGLASILKVIIAFSYERIPANYSNPLSRDLEGLETIPACLLKKQHSFLRNDIKKRYAQVSNFGFSGTNVCVILEEPPVYKKNIIPIIDGVEYPFVISAKREYSLKEMIKKYVSFLQETQEPLKDICYTALHYRDHFPYRCIFNASSKQQLIEQLLHSDISFVKVAYSTSTISIEQSYEVLKINYLKGASLIKPCEENGYNKVLLPLYVYEANRYWRDDRKPSLLDAIPMVSQNLKSEPIAIIGMSCRFPNAENLDDFLSLLQNGGDGMQDIPPERWNNEDYYELENNHPGKLCIKQLGLTSDIKMFDADFFNISPREAKLLSPQSRLFMMQSYHALEEANLSLDKVKGSNTGIFAGCGTNEYLKLMTKNGLTAEDLTIHYSTGNVISSIAGRVAYHFDFKGPTQTIDTACSSSMTAIHNACLSLQAGDCSMAIAGGVNVLLNPDLCIALSNANMLSPESRCKTFSDNADGYARSEGCGVLILKRLSDALKESNTIHAIIKGSAINSDGNSTGYTSPNGLAQEALIKQALLKAKLSPGDIDGVEAHGTGTPLADPIEIEALNHVFSASHSKKRPLYISSVKTNIGHLEAASGVAGVIKAVLSLKTQTFYKQINFKRLNPKIVLENTAIVLDNLFWKKEKGSRYIGVSSFGFTGSNAHVILQESYQHKQHKLSNDQKDKPCLFVLSAKTETSLKRLIKQYQHYFLTTTNAFNNLCYTAATGRTHYLYRIALVANSSKTLAMLLSSNSYKINRSNFQNESPLSVDSMPLSLISKAYLNGQCIDWGSLYDPHIETLSKVSLPLYEFEKKEHWFHDKNVIKEKTLPKDWCYQLNWQSAVLSQEQKALSSPVWYWLGGNNIANSLKAQGINLQTGNLNDEIINTQNIVFAYALERQNIRPLSSPLEAQDNIFKPLLTLVKQLHNTGKDYSLLIASHNAVAELSEGECQLGASSLLGFAKTLVLECPTLMVRFVDINLNEVNSWKALLPFLKDPFYQKDEFLIAYRNKIAFVPRFLKRSPIEKRGTFNKEGRYLITGGCGALGLISAQALLSLGAKDLVLLSRNITREITHLELKTIRACYPAAKIDLISVDVCNLTQLSDLFLEINHDNKLKGIIHAAGQAVKKHVKDHCLDDLERVFNAKILGAWHLHQLSLKSELNFFICYSSIASAFGSNKESCYAAANSFLDALMITRQHLGLVGCAVQWGPWGESGMAKQRSKCDSLKGALISNQQGHEFISRLFSNQTSKISIIPPDYLQFMLQFVPLPMPIFYQKISDMFTLINKIPEQVNLKDTWLSKYKLLNKEEQQTLCMTLVCSVCAGILENEVEEIEDNEAVFFELGFDSLMLTELSSKLQKILNPQIKVGVNIAFDHPNISQLSTFLFSELSQSLHMHTDEIKASNQASNSNDIAIIGLSCDFPHAENLTDFEAMLNSGHQGIDDIPRERWDNAFYYDDNQEAIRKSYVSQMGLLNSIETFDADFFNISPREARLIEPQQRLFLYQCFQAIAHANYAPEDLRGSLTGVFAGVGLNEYYSELLNSGDWTEELSAYSITGNMRNVVPGRVAYFFDFKGPALSIDTACSSSLVALKSACDSLILGDSDFALAGGVNVLLSPETNITLCQAKALSKSNRCHTFDDKADGYVRSEGCGVIFLKRMDDAIRDGDKVFAVIKAVSVNNDGCSAGLTVPNGCAQVEVMQQALRRSGLNPSQINMVEAHGTGTPLGDPIEVNAINQVYGQHHTQENPLFLSSVKTNLGHLESAAGISGLIKSVLCLTNKTVYPHLNFSTLNKHITLLNTQIPLSKISLKSKEPLIRIGINSFGFSGTNAHVILEEVPCIKQSSDFSKGLHLLVLSAKSKRSLDALVKSYQVFLLKTSEPFSNICFTAAVCRDHYSYRLVIKAFSAKEAETKLKLNQFKVLSNVIDSYKSSNTSNSLEALGSLYLSGKRIDWKRYYDQLNITFSKVILPNYAFDKDRHWVDTIKKNHLNQSIKSSVYVKEWQPLLSPTKVTGNRETLLLVSPNKANAQPFLVGQLFKYVSDISKVKNISDKTLVYIYQKGDLEHLFLLAKQLFIRMPHRFIFITCNAYRLNESDKVEPFDTMATAFWRVFSNELALKRNYAIDCHLKANLSNLINILISEDLEDKEMIQSESLYIPRLIKKNPEEEKIFSDPYYDPNACYLITGGAGGIGRYLVDSLILEGAKHIILLGRSKLSENIAQWIKQKESKGITLSYQQVNASNQNELLLLINNLPIPLKGVFHLAGVIDDGLIVNLTLDQLNRVIESKVKSALILHEITRELPLDFFVLFSSVAGLFGACGQANYAAANGFLEGLVGLKRHRKTKAKVIHWGPFKEIGMTVDRSPSLLKHGFGLIDPNSLFNLKNLFEMPDDSLCVCPMDWSIYLKNYFLQTWLIASFNHSPPKKINTIYSQLHALTAPQKLETLNVLLRTLIGETLGILHLDLISLDSDLFSLGLDSLLALELRSKIFDKLGISALHFPTEMFLISPTINKLSVTLLKEIERNIMPSNIKAEENQSLLLSDFQCLFWLLSHFNHGFNLGIQVRFKGDLNEKLFHKGIKQVIESHDALWLDFDIKEPVQSLNRKGVFAPYYEDMSMIKKDVSSKLNGLFHKQIMKNTSLREQPLIKTFLYKVNEWEYEFHLVVPHIVVDDVSLKILFRQIQMCYQSLCENEPVTLPNTANAFLSYVKKNNSNYHKDFKSNINFWRRYNYKVSELKLRNELLFKDASKQKKYLNHYLLDEESMKGFINWHIRKNLNPSYGLIVLCQSILFGMSNQTTLPIHLINTGRQGKAEQAICGLFSEYKRINLTYKENETLPMRIKHLEQQLVITSKYQGCSQLIKKTGLRNTKLTFLESIAYLCLKGKAFTILSKDKTLKPLRKTHIAILSKSYLRIKKVKIKSLLNRYLKANFSYQPPNTLTTLIDFMPSFYGKPEVPLISELTYYYPQHAACMNRPIGNSHLKIYFSKNQKNEYILSINGPIKEKYKNQMAKEINELLGGVDNSSLNQGKFIF